MYSWAFVGVRTQLDGSLARGKHDVVALFGFLERLLPRLLQRTPLVFKGRIAFLAVLVMVTNVANPHVNWTLDILKTILGLELMDFSLVTLERILFCVVVVVRSLLVRVVRGCFEVAGLTLDTLVFLSAVYALAANGVQVDFVWIKVVLYGFLRVALFLEIR